MHMQAIPYQRHATDKILLRSAIRLQKYSSLKVWTTTDKDGQWRLPSYKLCSPGAFGSGELKMTFQPFLHTNTWGCKFDLTIKMSKVNLGSSFKKDQQRTYQMILIQFFFFCFFFVFFVVFFWFFFITAYVVGTNLNCINILSQFKWVPTSYAFVD